MASMTPQVSVEAPGVCGAAITVELPGPPPVPAPLPQTLLRKE